MWQFSILSNDSFGYQRAPSRQPRKREIGRYLMEKDAILPIGGLLNARAQDNSDVVTYGELLQFEEESTQNGISFGKLTIPDESLPLWIVDMQTSLGWI